MLLRNALGGFQFDFNLNLFDFQVEMTGSSIFDYIHQADHVEIAEQLGLSLTSQTSGSINSPTGSEEGSSNGTHNPDG